MMMLMIMVMTMAMVMMNVVASSWHIAMQFTKNKNPQHLGGFLPILKGRKTSKIKPEFVIFDPLRGEQWAHIYFPGVSFFSVNFKVHCSSLTNSEVSSEYTYPFLTSLLWITQLRLIVFLLYLLLWPRLKQGPIDCHYCDVLLTF